MSYKGWFKPKFPKKYNGDPSNIVYRSLWEKVLMKRLDENPNVISWSSEEFFIPYFSEVDRKMHRYFVDFQVQFRDNDGTLQTWLIEVKPYAQTQEPVNPGRRSTRYLNECKTWVTNKCKWKAAEQYAADRGWSFKIMTEYELGLKKRR